MPDPISSEDRIGKLRELSRSILSQEKRTSRTEDEYTEIARRVLSETGNLATLSPAGMRKRTWYKVRASLRFYLATRILGSMGRAEKMEDGEELEKLMRGAEAAGRVLTTGPLSEVARFSPTVERKENRSKRRTLGTLPADWPETVFDTAPDSLKPAIAIHYLSGCRPQELEGGVRILKSTDGIEFSIRGTKVYQKNGRQIGQEERRLKISFSDETERKMATVLVDGVISVKNNAGIPRGGRKRRSPPASRYIGGA